MSPDYDGDIRPINGNYDIGADEAGGGDRMPVGGDLPDGGATNQAVVAQTE